MRTWTKRGEVIEALRAEPGLRVKNITKNIEGLEYRWGDGPEVFERVTETWHPACVTDGPWTEVIAKPEPRRAGPYVECSREEADDASGDGLKRTARTHEHTWYTAAALGVHLTERETAEGWFWARLERGEQ